MNARSHIHAPHNSYRPDISNANVTTLRRCILHLKHQQQTLEQKSVFIKEIRKKITSLHEYNLKVAKTSNYKYPRTKSFDMLLVEFLELEFDYLYCDNQRPEKSLEDEVENRILDSLRALLFKSVYEKEDFVAKDKCRDLNIEVLRIIAGVRTEYLVENKFISNIGRKLLLKIEGPKADTNNYCSNLDSYLKNFNFPKYFTTSDYGTDESDSDEKVVGSPYTDCYEVKNEKLDLYDEAAASTNSIPSIPTIELLDDDTYMVYLARDSSKRRCHNNKRLSSNKKINRPRGTASLKNETITIYSDSEDEVEVKQNKRENCAKWTDLKDKMLTNNEVIECSDSEDQSPASAIENNELVHTIETTNQDKQVDGLQENKIDISTHEAANEVSECAETITYSVQDIQEISNFADIFLPQDDETRLVSLDSAFTFQMRLQLSNSDDFAAVDNDTRDLGDPVLCRRYNQSEDDHPLQECRVNDSLLKEMFLDNSSLDERKDCDELDFYLVEIRSESGRCTDVLGSLDEFLENPRAEDSEFFSDLINKNSISSKQNCGFDSNNDKNRNKKRKRFCDNLLDDNFKKAQKMFSKSW